VTVETMVSDALIWATYLLIVVGGVAAVSIAVVSVLGRPGGRFTPAAARATNRRILRIAVIVYVAAFIGGAIVGLFQ
jgi:hypothetical protein